MAGALHSQSPTPGCPCLPSSPKAYQDIDTYFSCERESGGELAVTPNSAGAISRGSSAVAVLMAACGASDGMQLGRTSSSGGVHVLQKLVAERLGLAPTEEGKQMLHYVIPQVWTCWATTLMCLADICAFVVYVPCEHAFLQREQCLFSAGAHLNIPWFLLPRRRLGLSCSTCLSCWTLQTGSDNWGWQKCTSHWLRWRRSS